MPDVAVIVGGAECVWDDVERTRALCDEAGVKPEFFIINDMISFFPGEATVVTLHSDKLPGWLNQRQHGGHPAPTEIWCNSNRRAAHKLVTNVMKDRGGSSGLLAVYIALNKGYDRIILCGVPMETAANHFVRKVKWVACVAFWRAWELHANEIKPYARSFSGQTAKLLGQPTVEFLRKEGQAATAA